MISNVTLNTKRRVEIFNLVYLGKIGLFNIKKSYKSQKTWIPRVSRESGLQYKELIIKIISGMFPWHVGTRKHLRFTRHDWYWSRNFQNVAKM